MEKIKEYLNKNRLVRFLLIMVVVAIIGFIATIYINNEKEEQRRIEQLQAEKQAIMDDAAARAQQAEIDAKAKQQELINTTINKIKDYGEIVVMKYDFDHEISYEKTGTISFLSKNTLKLKINYEAEYKINVSNLNLYSNNGEIYLMYNPKDFDLLVSPQKVVKQSAKDDEKGWFPTDFTDEETIALVNSDIEYIDNELQIESSEYTDTQEVCDQFEKIIRNLFEGFGVKINIINNNEGKPYVEINNLEE